MMHYPAVAHHSHKCFYMHPPLPVEKVGSGECPSRGRGVQVNHESVRTTQPRTTMSPVSGEAAVADGACLAISGEMSCK